MAKRKNKKRKQETPNVVIEKIEVIEPVVTVPEVIEVPDVIEVSEVIATSSLTTTAAPTTTSAPINPDSTIKAKAFLQSVQEKQIEQIHDWLDSIEESMMLTKDILNNTTNNKEESFALKRIQKLYHQLNLIKNIKKGKTVIMGFNKKKLKN